MITIDATGLSCPEPVMLAQKATRDNPSEDVRITVDNATARNNILRMARGIERDASVQEEDGAFAITLTLSQRA